MARKYYALGAVGMLGAALLAAPLFLVNAGANPGRADAQTFNKKGATIMREFSRTARKFSTVMPQNAVLANAKIRQKYAPKALPLLRKLVDLTNQFHKADPKAYKNMRSTKYQLLALMDAFGDRKSRKLLRAEGRANTGRGIQAKVALRQAAWWEAGRNTGRQDRVLEKMKTLAKAHPYNNAIAMALFDMGNSPVAQKKEKAQAISLLQHMQSPAAKALYAHMTGNDLPAPIQALMNKKIAVSGRTMAGGHFSTKVWKGKPIIVDFWATWCPPCRMELPHVENAYKKFHKKGLEVLGVSSDYVKTALKSFLASHPIMKWPELYTPGTHWSPVATSYGITGIPTVFFINRKGDLVHAGVGYNPAELKKWLKVIMKK